ncbi:MAG: hypothetical protein HYY46_25775 [Deltaproteobacteria bacterium]|nr:hypothetical protein [Deltaproteobacteria bacterium]
MKAEQEGLEIAVEEYVTAEKSRRAFDADLLAYGVAPLLIYVTNQSSRSYRIEDKQITARLGEQALPFLSGIDAANQAATSEYAGKALGWTAATGPFALVFWPVTISVSGIHTKEINRKVERHFEMIAFGKAIVKPAEAASGFVYFKLPDGLNSLNNLTVEVAAHEIESGRRLLFKLLIPRMNVQE